MSTDDIPRDADETIRDTDEAYRLQATIDAFGLISEGDYQGALACVKPIADYSDELVSDGVFDVEDGQVGMCFRSGAAMFLYVNRNSVGKEIVDIDPCIDGTYHAYGRALMRCGDYAGAIEQLMKSIRWCPFNAKVYLDLAAAAAQMADDALFLDSLGNACTYAIEGADIASCLCAHGDLCARIGRYEDAQAYYVLSCKYDEQREIGSALEAIEEASGKKLSPMNVEQATAFLSADSKYVGYDIATVALLEALVADLVEAGKVRNAAVVCGWLYSLTRDEKYASQASEVVGAQG